jgi:hypothetical protein
MYVPNVLATATASPLEAAEVSLLPADENFDLKVRAGLHDLAKKEVVALENNMVGFYFTAAKILCHEDFLPIILISFVPWLGRFSLHPRIFLR